MELIIGGMAQGKLSYVLEQRGALPVTDGAVCSIEEAFSAVILRRFHLFLRRLLEEDADAEACTKKLMQCNPNCIILCDEIGCGIVPIDAFERNYRETVGRCCCLVAEHSDRVVRITCGLPQVIK